MNSQNKKSTNRAVVLGGGGVTGIAWEVGVLTGLLESGVDLHQADTIIGTSAGSFVGAALASGYDINKLFASQLESNPNEIPVSASKELMEWWYKAFVTGGSDPRKVGAEFGLIAKNNPPSVSPEQRRALVESRLVTKEWPQQLQVTAIDADTGQLHTFDHQSGIALPDAVSASGSVPGIWPLVSIGERNWTDGGMVSSTNARLAKDYKRIIILSPMPRGYGAIPGAAEEAAGLQTNAEVYLIIPDEHSVAAIGNNPYDPTRCGITAIAGREQARSIAEAVLAMWG
ncbi:patatin-like phospholipase family protein [Paenibacillus radicis (ex Gao et al. 2016)]|uniref:Patatin n=1 Tax=Paenibacillus radicis (ex Gao et al. 2016) TaxID=1737354 RepID=A0A917H7K9_9BACL|nr:patatin-like phospholipase family protein [Paenibacillus radicis (ex Gao et al. 2016)]GGG70112.1 patatin [Paenibacillus radicis (ex Gao et al. 2016)]